jgi:hypothetical protein
VSWDSFASFFTSCFCFNASLDDTRVGLFIASIRRRQDNTWVIVGVNLAPVLIADSAIGARAINVVQTKTFFTWRKSKTLSAQLIS